MKRKISAEARVKSADRQQLCSLCYLDTILDDDPNCRSSQ
jgi:hypothetical protein